MPFIVSLVRKDTKKVQRSRKRNQLTITGGGNEEKTLTSFCLFVTETISEKENIKKLTFSFIYLKFIEIFRSEVVLIYVKDFVDARVGDLLTIR